MEVLILTVFVSLLLVVGELLFFAWNIHQGTHDHSDRLALLPLEEERSPQGDHAGSRKDLGD